jgi:hypothetical protein
MFRERKLNQPKLPARRVPPRLAPRGTKRHPVLSLSLQQVQNS